MLTLPVGAILADRCLSRMKSHYSLLLLFLGLKLLTHTCRGADPDRPHVIVIVADDLGFNDVGFHGSTQIPTPNIDALAYSGVILNNYYVQPICTPSRSALMTGKHPIHTGKYTTDLFTAEAVEIINEHNTSQPLFLYLAHLAVHSGNPYAPLQAPEEVVKKFSYIEDENRRKFAGMLWKLDESVGLVVEALHTRKMLHNSIILFTTDNGGPAGGFNENAASNWPLRGVKASVWEGGVRGAGLLWSPSIVNPGRVADQMVHITDWLPTLITAAGGNLSALGPVDGMDVWDTLTQDLSSPRKEFLVNIDPVTNSGAVRVGDWKLIFNPQSFGHHWDGWFGPSGRNETAPETDLDVILKQVLNSRVAKSVTALNPKVYENMTSLRKKAEVSCGLIPENATASCDSEESPCLFHIPTDPCEYKDVAATYPDVLALMKIKLRRYNATAVPPRNKPWDPTANPKYWGYAWTNWKDFPSPVIVDS
ncbi:arylsulfatase B isoform X6 [Panulirus ornatus]|uniref:arylsulfatase B isoform X6 n=1 Tax=Panulirus ornatus TaxID=150431 RepID=UPI003A86CCD2